MSPLSFGKTAPSASNIDASSIGSFPKSVTLFPHVESISVPAVSVPKMNVPFQSNYPMQTRSKSGIFIPKHLVALLHQEPTTIHLALANSQWKNVMEVKYQALLRNNTWKLVPPNDTSYVIQSKWVFRIKLNVDGSLDKYMLEKCSTRNHL